MGLNQVFLRQLVRRALAEDIGSGDITTRRVIDESCTGRGVIRAKEPLVVAGLPVAREVFRLTDQRIRFRSCVREGDHLRKGDLVARVRGPASSILTAERTALNFLQHLSGIATYTERCVRRAGRRCSIRDTRKTTPGLRQLEKYAVRVGGGENHRHGLFDGILIKHNHWRLAGGVKAAVRRARPRSSRGKRLPVQVEVSSLEHLREAMSAGVEAVLLDNLSVSHLRKAMALAVDRVFVEISGGVTYEKLGRYAALRPQAISLGALTHRARWVDLSLSVSLEHRRGPSRP